LEELAGDVQAGDGSDVVKWETLLRYNSGSLTRSTGARIGAKCSKPLEQPPVSTIIGCPFGPFAHRRKSLLPASLSARCSRVIEVRSTQIYDHFALSG
jgi:hypothetical protein